MLLYVCNHFICKYNTIKMKKMKKKKKKKKETFLDLGFFKAVFFFF